MTTQTSTLTALETYIAQIEEIATLAARLVEFADDHGGVAPDDINWTHVANLTEVTWAMRCAALWAGIDLEAERDDEIAEWYAMMETEYQDVEDTDENMNPMALKL